MDKSKIPVSKEIVEGIELEIYGWMTQEEEKEFYGSMLGREKMEAEKLFNGDIDIKIDIYQAIEANKLLVSSLIKNLSWEEFNVLKPKTRRLVLGKLWEVVGQMGKV
jgi:hypothetical protein